MTWIKTTKAEHASGELLKYFHELKAVTPKEYGSTVASLTKEDGSSDSIVEAHSVMPKFLYHIFSGFNELLSPEGELTRIQQEMINTLVSAKNSCFY